MPVLIDYRCPCCNEILSGNEEVAIAKSAPPKEIICNKCKSVVRRVDADPTELVSHYYES
jgi:hypothetical protein